LWLCFGPDEQSQTLVLNIYLYQKNQVAIPRGEFKIATISDTWMLPAILLTMRFITISILPIFFFSCNNSKHDKTNDAVTIIDTAKSAMTDTTKREIIEQIDISIKSGFYDKESTFTNVEDYLYEIPFDHDWTKKQIDKAYANRLKEQSMWPVVTDFDKLVQAFDKLNSSGIVALHNAGITKQDGEEDSEEIHEDLLKKRIKTKGFCYYHWQDVERVVDDTHLYIGFGAFNNNNKDALEIGKQVAATLEGSGFKLDWDGTVATRIEITNIKWQKRFGNDNCSYEKAINLLSNQKN